MFTTGARAVCVMLDVIKSFCLVSSYSFIESHQNVYGYL
jgi:hypothetical protein